MSKSILSRTLLVIGAVTMLGIAAPATGQTVVSHVARQTPPIKLGTSGGWGFDLANGYCCGGTLGSLVTDGNHKYILSNFHVLAGDVAYGGNNDLVAPGDPVIQPGLIDVGCSKTKAQTVAKVSEWANPLSSSLTTKIDAAIAQVQTGMVSPDGNILEIGTISSATRAPGLFAVKKSGRTTRLTRSTITGINATISVSYESECAGSPIGTARFTNQIVVANSGSKFLSGGDSGSLLVEDRATNPRAVGLLFAGSSSTAIANPIQPVLKYFGVTMVGVGTQVQSLEETTPAIESAKKVQTKHAHKLDQIPKSAGHGIGIGKRGEVVIKVYVEDDTPEVRAAIPSSLDGIPVEIEKTGRIVAF